MIPTDTPRTDALMVNGCIAITILEHARTLERELNSITPAPVWPEIVRLQGKVKNAQNDAFNLANALSRAEAEVERLKRPYGCKCQTLRERALGDGCDECNKALVIEILTDERDELEAEVERLEKELSESHAQSHGLARRVIQAETMLEVVQRQLKNYTNAIETL